MSRVLPVLLAASWPAVAAAAWPPGEVFEDGVVLDVTPAGFAALGDGLPAVVPPTIDLPVDAYGYNFYVSDEDRTCVWGACVTWWEYEFSVWNGSIDVTVDRLDLVPRNGYLDLSIDLTLAVNAANDPLYLYAGAYALDFIGTSTSCDAYAEPFPIGASAPIYLDVVNGPDFRELHADIPAIEWSLGLSGNDLHLDDCALGDFIEVVQDFGGLVGFDPIGEIIGLLEGEIDSQIQALIPDLEAAIEDAFAQARVQESVDLAGATLDVTVEPYDIDITTAGARLQMAASFAATANPCVAAYGVTGSAETPSTLGATGSAPSGVSGHHVGAFVSDDFVDSGLFAAWRAGLLCYEVAESDDIPLNTALLRLMSPEAYADLFTETSPVSIVTRPRTPPHSTVDGAQDLTVAIRDLGVDLYTDLDHRQARVLGLDIATDVGIDLAFDEPTGALALDIAFDAGAIDATVAYNEVAAAHSAAIEGSLASLFETVLGPLVGGLVSDVTFPLPSVEGFGVTGLEAAAAGTPPGWFGLFATVGTVSYPSGAGCGESAACAGGCSTGGVSGYALGLLPALIFLRRRR